MMDEIAYRILEFYSDKIAKTKQEAWLYFHHTQIVPAIDNNEFDKQFELLKKKVLISWNNVLKEIQNERYLITEPGIKAYERVRELRLPAEKPHTQPNRVEQKTKIRRIIVSFWDIISNNALASAIIAGIVVYVISKFL